MPAKTSAASAICGTHFGLTKADTSIARWPAPLSASTKAILSAVPIAAASFCSPSRGPTSTMVTLAGLLKVDQAPVGLHQFAGTAVDRLDAAVGRRAHRQFHLHGLEHDQDVALRDAVSGRDLDGDDRRGHRRGQLAVSGPACGRNPDAGS